MFHGELVQKKKLSSLAALWKSCQKKFDSSSKAAIHSQPLRRKHQGWISGCQYEWTLELIGFTKEHNDIFRLIIPKKIVCFQFINDIFKIWKLISTNSLEVFLIE